MAAITSLLSRFTRGRTAAPPTSTTGRRVAGTRPAAGTDPGRTTGAAGLQGAARKLLGRVR